MPSHTLTLLLHSRVDVRLAFVLRDVNARAVFLALKPTLLQSQADSRRAAKRAAAVRTGFIFSRSCRLRGAGDRSTASLLAHALIDAILIRRGRPLKPSGATRIAESMHGFGGITPGGDPHCGSGCCRSSDRLSINIALRVRECGRAEDECPQRCGQHDATRMLDEAEERRCRHGRNLRAR